jgi:hypothetical protein
MGSCELNIFMIRVQQWWLRGKYRYHTTFKTMWMLWTDSQSWECWATPILCLCVIDNGLNNPWIYFPTIAILVELHQFSPISCIFHQDSTPETRGLCIPLTTSKFCQNWSWDWHFHHPTRSREWDNWDMLQEKSPWFPDALPFERDWGA